MNDYTKCGNTEAEEKEGTSPVFHVSDLIRMSELTQTAEAVRDSEAADMLGQELLGASGQRIGSISDLLVHPDSGQVFYALVELSESGENRHRRRFMLPAGCIECRAVPLRCAFERKQFEYGPQWHDGSGLFRLERHHAYWTGLLPHSGRRPPPQNESNNSSFVDGADRANRADK
jgi:sporulation protein YlmC with PRC-barrel domain